MEVNEYERYGRQMIVPEIGLQGQLKIKNSNVLVIGAGGLGCPAIAYLAGAGVGHLGIVDPDIVEESNLHRQILHRTIGQPKCESARDFVKELNKYVKVDTWHTALTVDNAIEICSQFDVVLDCTDTPMSRYLINDTCVVLGKPLVSASALKTEGQLAIYNYKNGPCYRCLFPRPPPPGTVTACGDGGIIGPVVGTMGVLQATEALKVITGAGEYVPCLMIYSAMTFPPWRSVKIRGRQAQCIVCGDSPQITVETLKQQDYVDFCGALNAVTIDASLRIPASQLRPLDDTIIDVRPETQFAICALERSKNIPVNKLTKAKSLQELGLNTDDSVVVVCRYGNDSQIAVDHLQTLGLSSVKDVIGGLAAWSNVDPTFPRY